MICWQALYKRSKRLNSDFIPDFIVWLSKNGRGELLLQVFLQALFKEKWYDNLLSIKSLTVIDKSIIIDYSQQNTLSIVSNSDIINQFLSIIDIIDWLPQVLEHSSAESTWYMYMWGPVLN